MADKKEETVEETTESKAEDTKGEVTEETKEEDESLVDKVTEAVTETVEDVVETVAETASDVAEAVKDTASDLVEAVTGDGDGEATEKNRKRRSEKVGIVYSDKMDKTVTVRVDRMVKHQLYQKYMKKRKKFMAHDELGATVGDRVRIVETRPLSARKRWRVIEIIQKAQK